MHGNETLQTKLRDLGQPVSGKQLVEFGKDAGIDHTQDELQTAFKNDRVMCRHAVACRQISLWDGLTETASRV